MKFVSLCSHSSDVNSLSSEYKSSKKIGTVSFGSGSFFFKKGLKVYYIPYSQISGYFKRVYVIPRRTLKGEVKLQVENIVICSEDKKVCVIRLFGNKLTSEAMEKLKEMLPGVPSESKKAGE